MNSFRLVMIFMMTLMILESCNSSSPSEKSEGTREIEGLGEVGTLQKNDTSRLEEGERFDELNAQEYPELFRRIKFKLVYWDTASGQGFVVMSSSEVLYLKKWAGADLGFHIKIFINDDSHDISPINLKSVIDEIISYSTLCLDAEEITNLRKSIELENYSMEDSKLTIGIQNAAYNEFWVSMEQMNMSTTVFQLYCNRAI